MGDIVGNGKLFSATDFPSGDRVRPMSMQQTIPPGTEGMSMSREARTFAGTFNGIPGEYDVYWDRVLG